MTGISGPKGDTSDASRPMEDVALPGVQIYAALQPHYERGGAGGGGGGGEGETDDNADDGEGE